MRANAEIYYSALLLKIYKFGLSHTRYLRKNDGYIYYSAALVIHSSSIFHSRIPRILCHLREPSISTDHLSVPAWACLGMSSASSEVDVPDVPVPAVPLRLNFYLGARPGQSPAGVAELCRGSEIIAITANSPWRRWGL
jgi:hypothetical protein